MELFEGYVTSADNGSESLVRASRAALADFCEHGIKTSTTADDVRFNDTSTCDFVCNTLLELAKRHIANDRILVPTLEVMSFLFDIGVMQQSNIK